MTNAAAKWPEETTDKRPAGQRAGRSNSDKEHRNDGSAGTWSPGRARHDPPKEKDSHATTFDRLAKAAAAHDGEVTAGIFGEPG
jgi:hypothetical protein